MLFVGTLRVAGRARQRATAVAVLVNTARPHSALVAAARAGPALLQLVHWSGPPPLFCRVARLKPNRKPNLKPCPKYKTQYKYVYEMSIPKAMQLA